MRRFVVVTDPDTAVGFRLAGVDAVEARTPEEARGVIASLSAKEDTGILAVNEDFLAAMDEKFMDRIEKLRRPIVIPVPSGAKGADPRSYIERLLRKAIGYNVVMRR
jgi:V/A-type H+-transporting ATPase subunit F